MGATGWRQCVAWAPRSSPRFPSLMRAGMFFPAGAVQVLRDEPEVLGEPMKKFVKSRRHFLKTAGMTAGAMLLSDRDGSGQTGTTIQQNQPSVAAVNSEPANYTLRIKTSPVEIAKNRILSLTTYNGQFPGPL